MQTSQGRSDGLPSSTLLKGRVPGKVSANARASTALADTFPAAFITLRRKNWKQAEKLNSGLYYRQKKHLLYADAFFHVRDKIRTRDLLVRSQTLYPAELHVQLFAVLQQRN